MRRLLPSAGVVVLLAACTAQGDPPLGTGAALNEPVPEAEASEELRACNGNGFVRYIGAPVVRPGDRIPEEGAYVTWEDLPVKSRVLGPGVMATMDFVPDRLNVVVDAQGRIRRLYCG